MKQLPFGATARQKELNLDGASPPVDQMHHQQYNSGRLNDVSIPLKQKSPFAKQESSSKSRSAGKGISPFSEASLFDEPKIRLIDAPPTIEISRPPNEDDSNNKRHSEQQSVKFGKNNEVPRLLVLHAESEADVGSQKSQKDQSASKRREGDRVPKNQYRKASAIPQPFLPSSELTPNGEQQQQSQYGMHFGNHRKRPSASMQPLASDSLARPYELVEIRNGKLLLNYDLLEEAVLKYEGAITIMSVQGHPNTGKSRFLNGFLDEQQQQQQQQQQHMQMSQQRKPKRFFERSGADSEGTEGLVLWGQPIYNSQSNTHIFLVDVQGVDEKDELNLKLQLLALLLSDIVVFMSDNSLKNTIKRDLRFLLEIQKRLQFPILDIGCRNYMPQIALFAAAGATFSTNDSDYDDNTNTVIDNNSRIEEDTAKDSSRQSDEGGIDKHAHSTTLFEGDHFLEKYLHSLDSSSKSSDQLKIKKILTSVFRDKYCFLRNNVNEYDSSVIGSKQFFSAPDKETSMQRLSAAQQTQSSAGLSRRELRSARDNSIDQSETKSMKLSRTEQQSTPAKNSFKTMRQASRFQDVVQSVIRQRPPTSSFSSVQGRSSMSNQKTAQNLSLIRSVNNENPSGGKEAEQFAFIKKIIRLSCNQKRFKNISLNAFTFCQFVRLLVEEINAGECIDPRITASRAVVCELQRVSQSCLSDHEAKIHSFVNFDSFQSMQSAMTSLLSIRTSTLFLFTQTVGRFLGDKEYAQLYEVALDTLKKTINRREEQVFHLFHNTSFGVNEERLRVQEQGEQIAQTKDEKRASNNNELKEYVNGFQEQISTFQKDFLSQGREIDAMAKIRVLRVECMKGVEKKLGVFSSKYTKMYTDWQIEILEKDSNKKIHEKVMSRFAIIKQKSKILDELTKNSRSEIDNLRELERVIHDRFLSSYNSQSNQRKNLMQQRIHEKNEQIKILEEKRAKLMSKNGSMLPPAAQISQTKLQMIQSSEKDIQLHNETQNLSMANGAGGENGLSLQVPVVDVSAIGGAQKEGDIAIPLNEQKQQKSSNEKQEQEFPSPFQKQSNVQLSQSNSRPPHPRIVAAF